MDAAPAAPEVEEAEREIAHVPLVLNRRNFSWLTERISGVVEQPAPRWWWVAFTITASAATFGLFCLGYQISTGVGTWGNNIPVGWAWDITNFVFWIGIGHAGTLISAILFLLRQKWRTSINRSAEAMTLFAVICAAIFPGVHVGRVWMAWYLAPIPNNWAIWPNFRSPLMWDVFAVSTYFTVSVLFWYTGLVPDLATLRDRASTKIKKFLFGIFALGWRGSNRHWRHYEMAYLLLAGLSTPLVLSVHSVVSFDFATSVLPTWHTTIFPPYFVAGAIFGGFAMVLTLLIPVPRDVQAVRCHHAAAHRQNGEDHFADRLVRRLRLHDGIFCRLVQRQFLRAVRVLEPRFWTLLVVLVGSACCSATCFRRNSFWFRWCRCNVYVVYFVCMCVNAGMWFERFIIIVGGLHRDFLPSSWGLFIPTWVDIWTYIGTLGIFTSLFLLFVRFLPMIAMSEVKTAVPEADVHLATSPGIQSVSPGGKERTR